MNCNQLRLFCVCRHEFQAGDIQALFLTDEHTLLAVCICQKCERQVSVGFSLAELYKGCPPSTEQLDKEVSKEIATIAKEAGAPLKPPVKLKFDKNDKKFLHSLLIGDPDDELAS